MDLAELARILEEREPALSLMAREKVLKFYTLLREENQVQNLTRLVEPLAFYQGHFIDVRELLKTGWMDYPAMDLGSGVGVPGLLSAVLSSDSAKTPWVLAESEKRKAEYLEKTVNNLDLAPFVRVFHGRAEEFLKSNSVQSIVVRAVGTVEKIYSWVRECSTWNNLILLKGPKWEEEWLSFSQSRFRKELVIESEYSYGVAANSAEFGDQPKSRKILKLTRVPRGTSNTRKVLRTQ